MSESVQKHSIVIAGRKTSVSLEIEFWKHLKRIAHARDMNIGDVVAPLQYQNRNLSSAIRLFVLADLEAQIASAATTRAAAAAALEKAMEAAR